MVIEWLLGLAVVINDFVTGLFPDIEFPDWFVNIDDRFNAVFASIDGLGAWVDFGLAITCVMAALGTWVSCLGIKALRAAAAHVPFVGGSG